MAPECRKKSQNVLESLDLKGIYELEESEEIYQFADVIVTLFLFEISPCIKPKLYIMCKLIKKRENIKNNLTDLWVIANFNEYAISTESIKIIRQTKAIVAVLDKKESMSREIPERMRPNDTKLNLARRWKSLLTFFPLANP